MWISLAIALGAEPPVQPPPKVVTRVEPAYPDGVGSHGRVACPVEIQVESDGAVADLEFDAGCPEAFRFEISRAVLDWAFEPIVDGEGKPQWGLARETFTFEAREAPPKAPRSVMPRPDAPAPEPAPAEPGCTVEVPVRDGRTQEARVLHCEFTVSLPAGFAWPSDETGPCWVTVDTLPYGAGAAVASTSQCPRRLHDAARALVETARFETGRAAPDLTLKVLPAK